jgi:hypothetical protein
MEGKAFLRLQVATLAIALPLATAGAGTARAQSAGGASPRADATDGADESRPADPAAEVEPRADADEPETSGLRPDVSAPAAAGSPGVALARFTTAVEGREPIDAVTFLSNGAREVLFYTDLRGLEGETVVHRWEFAGEVMAEVPFEVGGERWRVWSSKALRPEWTGDWTASVVGPQGEVLAIETFTYQPAR